MKSSKHHRVVRTWSPRFFASKRRDFLRGLGLVASALVNGSALGTLAACSDRSSRTGGRPQPPAGNDDDTGVEPRSDYGELRPKLDQNGHSILALPDGFEYVTFSAIGETMSDGNLVPRALDGMTCFARQGGIVRLIRNHEVRTRPGSFDDPGTFSVGGPPESRYDPLGVGGTVTLDFDLTNKTLLRHFVSLNGTIVNCSGGLAWQRRGWLSSEESVSGPIQGWQKKHGYNFLVPVDAESAVPAVPLTWMGRFRHEAALADSFGVIYQTEDADDTSGFYRATPNDPDNLELGGQLEMLAIKGMPQANLFEGQRIGASLPVEWVSIENADPDLENAETSCFVQGFNKGGAAFSRLEGIFLGPDGRSIYFTSTTGGDSRYGQVWQYIPADEALGSEDRLILMFESPDGSTLDSPDNLCISPRGGLLFCEDDSSNDGDIHPLAPGITEVTRLIGMSAFGEPFEFAVNLLNDSEFSGACFSPDGSTLFVNIYGRSSIGSGMTCAIWGPWERGPL